MAKHIHVHLSGKTKDAISESDFKSKVGEINRLLTEAARKAEALVSEARGSGMGQLSNQARLLEEQIDSARSYAFKIR